LGPRQIKTCVLLDKPSRRVEQIAADYVGFTIPNHFVVGYGLDYAESVSQSALRRRVASGDVLPGVGSERAGQLQRLELGTVGDLLLHRPRRYEDRRHFQPSPPCN
jgi:hypothetical protein